jgi:CHAT domain-containing protein
MPVAPQERARMSSIVTRVFGLDDYGRPLDGPRTQVRSDPDLAQLASRRANEPVILFLTANPDTTTQIQLPREMQAIKKQLRMTRFGRRFRTEFEPAAVFTDLAYYLADATPNIVHFSGHGTIEGIVLEDENGGARVVRNEALFSLFASPDITANLRLVVLNSCYSLAQASAIVANVDCVVGMSNRIPDVTAKAFSRSFYMALGEGLGVGGAFELAKAQLDVESMPSQELVTLLKKEGIDARDVKPLALETTDPEPPPVATVAPPRAPATSGIVKVGDRHWRWQASVGANGASLADSVELALRRMSARKVEYRNPTLIIARFGGWFPGAPDATEELTVSLPTGTSPELTISCRSLQLQVSDFGRNEAFIRQLLAILGIAE